MTRNTAALGRPLAVELGAAPRGRPAATTPPAASHSGPRESPSGGRGVKISKFALALGGAGDRMRLDEKAPTPPLSPWPCSQRCSIARISRP